MGSVISLLSILYCQLCSFGCHMYNFTTNIWGVVEEVAKLQNGVICYLNAPLEVKMFAITVLWTDNC